VDPGVLLPALLVGAGMATVAVGLLTKLRSRDESLADILDLPYGEQDVPVTVVTERSTALFEGAPGLVNLATSIVDRFDERNSLSKLLERAQLALRPGEYILLSVAGGTLGALFLLALTGEWLYGPVAVALAVLVAMMYPRMRISRRQRAIEEQLPDAISLIAGSLTAGHTFLRAMQMMVEEAPAPLSEEFARVVQETRLGDSVVDALDRMAQRIGLRDLEWIVQAIRIQQTVGGKLADLLYTLADYIRSREEIRREVRVLTAEGRISAWFLGGLPVLVLLAIQATNPDYMKPMYQGWGVPVMIGTFVSVGCGVALILKMSKIKI
jgi:tight adherence protein B